MAIVAGVLIPIYAASGIAIFLWDTLKELGMLIAAFLMLPVLLCCLLDQEKETRPSGEQGEEVP